MNIAIGKPTSQSSTLSTSYSSLAVDGKTDGDFRRGSCSHTDTDDQPWFRLDLERSTTVERVSEEFDYSNAPVELFCPNPPPHRAAPGSEEKCV